MPYHVNPETGNVLLCKAKKKCRFGSDTAHYATAEEGRAAYEKKVALSTLTSSIAGGTKLSKGAKLLLALDRAQQTIAHHLQVNIEEGRNAHADGPYRQLIDDAVEERNRLQRRVTKELSWDDTDAPPYDDSITVALQVKTFEPDEVRVGYSNDSFTPDPISAGIFRQMDGASAEWIKRLSTAEIKAVVAYNVGADAYAQFTGGGEPEDFDPRVAQYLHSAVAKAPRSATPVTVLRAYRSTAVWTFARWGRREKSSWTGCSLPR